MPSGAQPGVGGERVPLAPLSANRLATAHAMEGGGDLKRAAPPAELTARADADDAADEEELDLDCDTEFFESLDESAWLALDTSAEQGSQPAPVPAPAPAGPVGFQKANGKRLARPSASAMQQAAKRLRLDEDDVHDASTVLGAVKTEASEPAPMAPTDALRSMSQDTAAVSGGAQAAQSAAAAARACTPGPSTHTATPAPRSQPAPWPPSSPAAADGPSALRAAPAPAPASSLATSPVRAQLGAFAAPETPLRTPQRATPVRARPGSALGTTRSRTIPSARAQRGGTPSISVGLSPCVYRTGVRTPGSTRTFTPPFKKAPATPVRAPPERVPLFDLTAPAVRHDYRAAGFWPRPQTWEAAIARGVPVEACMILADPPCAAHYTLSGTHGVDEALAALHALGARRATRKWVQHHYALILWKLAGYAVSSSSDPVSWWRWEHVLNALRYRYEREVHRGAHSCVKRIQERTAPADRAMVLCVYAVQRLAHTDPDEGPSTVLHLTDGWYLIRAELDAPLQRAVDAGKIRRGHKLGICAAQLHAFGDGTPALDALPTSDLVLAANSTALVPWDARLGFQRAPFVSSLSRLTSDGGIVGAMDVVLHRIYPTGYQEGHRDVRGLPVFPHAEHSAEEEAERAARWQTARHDAEAQLRTAARRVQAVLAWLEARVLACEALEPSHAQGTYAAPSNPATQAYLAELEQCEDPTARLAADAGAPDAPQRQRQLLWCARLRDAVLSAPESEAYAAALDALCPARVVRSLCIVRFHDARPTRRVSPRTVQLTVWDPPALAVGARYLVTRLVPTQRASWRAREVEADVFLATTRATRWHAVHST